MNCFTKISWWQWHFWYSCWSCGYPIQLSKALLDILYWRDTPGTQMSDIDRTIRILQKVKDTLNLDQEE